MYTIQFTGYDNCRIGDYDRNFRNVVSRRKSGQHSGV